MKTISVVLTRYPDILSNVLCMFRGSGYSHASISLDEKNEEMYSFNMKGFSIESFAKYRRHGVKWSSAYQLQISDDAHEKLKKHIAHFVERRYEYRYTKLGLVCSVLRIPFHWSKHYFCSQFVAEMLHKTGAIHLQKAPSLYLPNHFCRELANSVQLSRIQYSLL